MPTTDEHFRFPCPACGKRLKARPEHAGRKAKCSCGQDLVVPTPDPLPESAGAAPPAMARQRDASAARPLPLPEEDGPAPAPRRVWVGVVCGAVALAVVVVGVVIFASQRPSRTADSDALAGSSGEPKREQKFDGKQGTSEPKRDKREGEPEPKRDAKEGKPEPIRDKKPDEKSEPKPKEGSQAVAPVLSGLTIRSTTTDPVVIKFALELDVVRGTRPFEEKAALWFCFGTPTTIPSLRAHLESQMKDREGVFFLNMTGPGFVAAGCSGIRPDDRPGFWTGTINLGKANIRDGQVEVPWGRGSSFYKLTEVPISWVYYDGAGRVSNEIKVTVDLNTGKVIKREESPAPAPATGKWAVEKATAAPLDGAYADEGIPVQSGAVKAPFQIRPGPGARLVRLDFNLRALTADDAAIDALSAHRKEVFAAVPDETFRFLLGNGTLTAEQRKGLTGKYRLFDLETFVLTDATGKAFKPVWCISPEAEVTVIYTRGTKDDLWEKWMTRNPDLIPAAGRLAVRTTACRALKTEGRFRGLMEVGRPAGIAALYEVPATTNLDALQLVAEDGKPIAITKKP